jgi:hypothetical protein
MIESLAPRARTGPRHFSNCLQSCIASFLLVASSVAMAGEAKVYVWTAKDGVVTYSQDRPPAGQAFSTREITTKSLTPAQRAAVKAQLARSGAKEAADATRFQKQLAAADQRIVDDVRRLADAEQALRNGREPLAGERVGNARGGSRLRGDYFERQKQLELAVQAARATLDDGYRARSELTP